MISYLFLLLLLLILINANKQLNIGIINHNTQWYIHCSQNNTQILNPLLNEQSLISYQCPYPSLSIDILPIEIDFTFICRLESHLIWIIIDLYQYNLKSSIINNDQLNISLILNQKIKIRDYKNEIHNYKNRFILINAFYIPFETIEILINKQIEILIEINQCIFYINDNLTWNNIINRDCNLIQSKTLIIQYAKCDFFPQTIIHDLQVLDESTTNIPDFNVFLSIDEEKSIETTTHLQIENQRLTTINYHLLFEEHYQHILSSLTILTRTWNLLTIIFILTIIILILLIIFFIYIICYHYHIRSI